MKPRVVIARILVSMGKAKQWVYGKTGSGSTRNKSKILALSLLKLGLISYTFFFFAIVFLVLTEKQWIDKAFFYLAVLGIMVGVKATFLATSHLIEDSETIRNMHLWSLIYSILWGFVFLILYFFFNCIVIDLSGRWIDWIILGYVIGSFSGAIGAIDIGEWRLMISFKDHRRFLESTSIENAVYRGKYGRFYMGVSAIPENGEYFAEAISDNNQATGIGKTPDEAIAELEISIDDLFRP